MMTEVFGFLIILGTIIFFIAKRYLHSRQEQEDEYSPEKYMNITTSASQLRHELETSADEIIEKMSQHIDHLEDLIERADRRSDVLEQQLAEMAALQSNVEVPEEEEEELPYRGGEVDILTEAEDLHDGQETSWEEVLAEEEAEDLAAEEEVLEGRLPELNEAEEASLDAGFIPEAAEEAVDEAETLLPELEAAEEASLKGEQTFAEKVANEEAKIKEETEPKPVLVRKMLAEGKTVNEIAKETGLGKGAIELIKQLAER